MAYYVIGSDGNRYGPANIDALRQWAKEGRVVPSTALEEEGTGRKLTAAEVPELGLNAQPAPQPAAAPLQQPRPAPTPMRPETPAPRRSHPITPTPEPRSGGSGVAAIVVILILAVVGAALYFTVFKKPSVVGKWGGDMTSQLNNVAGGRAKINNAKANLEFKSDGNYTISFDVSMSNPMNPAQTMQMTASESGTYEMNGSKGTSHPKSSSVTMNGQTMSMPNDREGTFELKDANTIVLSNVKAGGSERTVELKRL